MPKGDTNKFDKKSDIPTKYPKERKTQDARFGDFILRSNKAGNNAVMEKTKTSQTEKEAKNMNEQSKTRLNMNHPHLQTMIDWSEKYNKGMCASFWQNNAYYEYAHRYVSNNNTFPFKKG